MTQSEKFEYMTTTPVKKLICTLAVPTIISMLITSFYNMADTFFVGKINTSATGAVGVVFSLMAVIQAIGFFFGQGSGSYISRCLGRQDEEAASKMASTGFFYAIFFGFLFLCAGLLFLKPLSYLLGSTDTILPYTQAYLRIILFGAPYMTASLVLNNQLRFQGSALYGMIGITTGAILNVLLDPVLIFVLDMGISGAALATIISQFVSFCLLLTGCMRGGNIRISWKNFTPSRFHMKEIIRGGLPSLARQGLASLASISLNLAAGVYGDAAIAAMSIVNRITFFASAALIGFGQGFQPVCGFNYGAGLYRRVKQAFYFCVKYAAIFLTVLSILGILFAPQLVAVFRKEDAEVIAIGTSALRFQCITLPFTSYVILSNMLLQAIGKATKATILSAGRQGLFFLPAIWILPALFGMTGIQCSQSIADMATFCMAIPFSQSVLKKFNHDLINNQSSSNAPV